MDALASVKAPTQEYREVAKQIADTEKKQAALNDRMTKFLELGGKTNSKQYKSMQYDAAELENTIAYAKGELQDLVDTGKAFTLGNSTAEFNDLSRQLSEEQARLNELTAQYQNAQNNLSAARQAQESAENFRRMGAAADKAFSTTKKGAISAEKALGVLLAGVKKITAFAGKAVLGLSGLKGISKTSEGAIGHLGKRMFSLAKTVFVFGILRRALTAFKDGVQEGFGTYLNYDSSLKAAIAGLRVQLNALKGSLASAFAPIISVIVPYLSTLISWVTTAANAVAAFIATLMGKSSYKKAVANVGAVGAAADDTAGSLNDATKAAEELEKALGHYDELNVIEQPNSSGGGSSGGGGGSGGSAGDITYEDVEIASAISDFAEKVKEAWENSDFTEIGEIIGQKLEDALESIPWDGIQATAQKIGKSVATLINGFVETSGLGDMVGKTVAEGINTGLLGVESFTGNLHFASVGQFIADGINSALDSLEWSSLTTIAENIGGGLADALNSIMTVETFSNIGQSFANAINSVISGAYTFVTTGQWSDWGTAIASSVNDFFSTFDWKKAGLTFSDAANGILNTLVTAVKGISWDSVGTGIAEALKTVEWESILKSAADLIGSIFSGLLDFAGAVVTRLGGAEWSNYILDVKEATDELERANQEIQNRIDKAAEWKDAGAEYDYAKELIDQYFDLAEKESLSNEEKEQMKDLAGELVGTIPQLQQYYNSETGLLDTTRQSVDNLIESLKTKARTEAAQDALKELYSAQMDAKDAMDQCDQTAKELAEQHDLLAAEYEKATAEVKKYTDAGDYETQASQQASQQASYYKTELEKLEAQQAANTEAMENATENYNAAGKEIDKITDYVAEYSSEVNSASGKTDELTKKLQNLSKESQITINASLNGFDVTTEQKLAVIAEVTGTDYSKLPVSEKYINDMYANITKAYPQSGVSINAPAFASSLSNNGKTLYAPMNASYLGNNGKTLYTPMNASYLGNNGKTVTAPVKASKVSSNGKTLSVPIKATKISNTKTVGARIRITGQSNTPTVKVKAQVTRVAGNRISGYTMSTGGVYSNNVWKTLPQKAAGGIFQSNFWKSIPKYATGGSPHGTMFVAGEAGPEVVGHVGGRTEVLNKSQIASAIASAISGVMNTALKDLGTAVLSHMTECTNMVIANMGSIMDAIYSAANISTVQRVQFAGIPNNHVTDTNRTNAVYNAGYSGGTEIDYAKLAGAVANRISGNIEIPINMTLDGNVVYRDMVRIDRATVKQTGKSGFGG